MTSDLRWPLARNVIRRNKNSNTFGNVRRNANGTIRPHQGWDFSAPIGTPCFAIADGRIEFAELNPGGLGNCVALAFTHDGQKLYAVYAHLKSFSVSAGQTVSKGQQIGLTGESGNAAGMAPIEQHLHFEIRTSPKPGKGLVGRISPLAIYGLCPMHEAVMEDGSAASAPATPAPPPAAGPGPLAPDGPLPVTGQGWEIHIKREATQTRAGRTRTVGHYQVYHDGEPQVSFRLGDRDVPLSGTTAEQKGPGQNETPATSANPTRIREGTYPLGTQGGQHYVTFNYRPEPDLVAYPLPGIELGKTGNRTEILIHPGKNEFISSIGCINLCTSLPNAAEDISFPGSRRRVIALIEDMKAWYKDRFPTGGNAPIPDARVVIDGEP